MEQALGSFEFELAKLEKQLKQESAWLNLESQQ